MKPVIKNFSLKKSASVLAAAALLSLGTVRAHATPVIEKILSPNEQNVSVQFLGATENNLVFHLEFENKSGEKFWLIIKNDAGDVVYQETYTDLHFAKNIRITKVDSDINPTFVIRTATGKVERKFSVKNKVSETLVVTSL
jgi:hypothetical protein